MTSKLLFWDSEFWDAQEIGRGMIIPGMPFARWEIRDTTLSSGYVGYFGGIDPSLSSRSRIGTYEVLVAAERFAISHDLNALEIRMPPLGYFPQFDQEIYEQMNLLGWKEIQVDTFSSIKANADLNVVLRDNRKYDIEWWEKRGAEYLSGNDLMPQAFKIIDDNLRSRGRFNSITLDTLNKLAEVTPNRIHAHLISANREILAAAITLKIDDFLLHIFKWANNPRSEAQFPSVLPLMFKRILQTELVSPSGRICLGTSSENGEVNVGLLRFKSSLGFETSLRKVMRKNLEGANGKLF